MAKRDDISFTKKPQEPAGAPRNNVRVCNCERLNMRKGPSRDTEVLAVHPKGTRLVAESSLTNDWVYVHLPDVRKGGYVMKAYIEVAPDGN